MRISTCCGVLSFSFLGLIIGMIVLTLNAGVQQANCQVVNQTIVRNISFEPLDCHCVDNCYYDPCPSAKPVPCCQATCPTGQAQQCTMDNLYITTLLSIIQYQDVFTHLENVLKRRGNFTPNADIQPKVVSCWYLKDNLGHGRITELHSYPFKDESLEQTLSVIGILLIALTCASALCCAHTRVQEDSERRRALQSVPIMNLDNKHSTHYYDSQLQRIDSKSKNKANTSHR